MESVEEIEGLSLEVSIGLGVPGYLNSILDLLLNVSSNASGTKDSFSEIDYVPD